MITLTLKKEWLDKILNILARAPYIEVAEIIAAILQQVNAQANTDTSPTDAP